MWHNCAQLKERKNPMANHKLGIHCVILYIMQHYIPSYSYPKTIYVTCTVSTEQFTAGLKIAPMPKCLSAVCKWGIWLKWAACINIDPLKWHYYYHFVLLSPHLTLAEIVLNMINKLQVLTCALVLPHVKNIFKCITGIVHDDSPLICRCSIFYE